MRSWDCSQSENEEEEELGKEGITWQRSGMKSKNWRESWNKEGWKEALGSSRSCEGTHVTR